MDDQILDKNLFMMCPHLNRQAISELPDGFHIRSCRKEELSIWKAMPFDTSADLAAYGGYMDEYFERVYASQEELFFAETLFVCNASDESVATCLLWKAHQEFNTIHWLKVIKSQEGLGIGRALLSIVLRDLPQTDYPIYLHTQPGSYRAIKLYTDFGFILLTDKQIGIRKNELEESMPYLKQQMPRAAFQQLKFGRAPASFLERLAQYDTNEF